MYIEKKMRNTLFSLIAAFALSACGSSSSSNDNNNLGAEDNSTVVTIAAPSIAYTSSANAIDLANYKQVGTYNLPIPDANSINLLAQEASAITYDKDTDSLFVVGDGGTAVVQVTKKGELIDSMTLADDPTKPQGTAFYDTEGIAYIGNGKFALVEERDRQISRFTYVSGGTLTTNDVKTVKLGTTIGNIGIEGISYDPKTSEFIAVKEADPEGVFITGINFDAGTATNGSASTENSVNMFDPAKVGVSAINDVYSLSNTLTSTDQDYDQILLLSAPEGKVVKIDRNGNIQSTLDVGADAQNEGLTVDADKNIYTVNEVGGGDGHPQMFVFSPVCETPASGSNICLTFDQAVKAGSGNLVIDNGTGDKRTIPVSDQKVSFSGNSMIINLDNLIDDSTYTVTYANGVIKNATNPVSGISNASLKFSSSGVTDTKAPELVSSIPEDNAINFAGGSIILTFNEAVIAGNGNIVITDNDGVQTLIDVTDTDLVRFGGKSVVITPSSSFTLGKTFHVQMAAGVITDLSTNAYAGISDDTTLNFETAAPAVPQLLISEANSKSNGGDFFELYNFGASAVDLSGWRYNDSSADFASAIPFPDGTTIEAGDVLLVHVGPETNDEFKTAWGLNADVNVITLSSDAPTDAPKLGGGDAVVIFDNNGAVAAAFNYTGTALGSIPVSTRSDGAVMGTDLHAGQAVGDANTAKQASAVWDGLSTSNPAYYASSASDLGFIKQDDNESAGTPGTIPAQDNTKLLISEVDSDSEGGDFFELYNFGTASLNLSGWVYDDDSASFNAGTAFPNHIVIPAGKRLVVNVKQSTEAFKSIWDISEAGAYVLLESGSGLSKGDAVVLFDAKSNFVTGFNYGMSAIPVLDSNASQIATLEPAQNSAGEIPTNTLHAGPAFGGATDGTSVVWDGLSTSSPRYTAAVIGVANAFSPDDNVSIASPGK